MSVQTEVRKCGRCMALENVLAEFHLTEGEVERLKSGGEVLVPIGAELYERMRRLLEK